MVLKRIDEISLAAGFPIETPSQRALLLEILAPIYARFNQFLVQWKPNAYVGSQSRADHDSALCTATFEWHLLHEHLVSNAFTMEVLEDYIRVLSGLSERDDVMRIWNGDLVEIYGTYTPILLNPADYPMSNPVYRYY
jgi:hypothetical protein